jgi:hypothetical protein
VKSSFPILPDETAGDVGTTNELPVIARKTIVDPTIVDRDIIVPADPSCFKYCDSAAFSAISFKSSIPLGVVIL